MVSLNAGPMYVALTQTASALPFFVFALPAGAIGDIVDRRKLILFTETWMVGVALILAVLTIAGLITPLSLLILTFARGLVKSQFSPISPNPQAAFRPSFSVFSISCGWSASCTLSY
jgi:MFS family permease